MIARANVSLNLDVGGEAPRAVAVHDGSGCNLWLSSIRITAATAEQFRELAAAALEAAVIQEGADARKKAPHAFIEHPSLSFLGNTAPCALCGVHKRDHAKAGL